MQDELDNIGRPCVVLAQHLGRDGGVVVIQIVAGWTAATANAYVGDVITKNYKKLSPEKAAASKWR